MPPWAMATALALGMSGLACLLWGVLRNHTHAVRTGHFVVSAHMAMYLYGSGGNWIIGMGTVAFAAAGFVYPAKHSDLRFWIWLILSLPPGVVYLVSMGIFALVLFGGGM